MNYFILVNNEQQGPYTVDELRARHISEETLVWCEGMAQWTPAWQVEELHNLLFTPPLPGDSPTPNRPNEPNRPTMPTEPTPPAPPQKKSRRPLYIALGVIVLILFVLALTNPGQAEHRKAIVEKLDTTTINNADPTLSGVASMLRHMGRHIGNQLLLELVNEDLEYNNYIFFSTTSIHSNLLQKDIRTSTGFLGHINAVSLANVLPDLMIQQMTGSDNDEQSLDRPDSDVDGQETTVTTSTVKKNGVTVDSITKRVTKRLADDVASQVKKEVRQQSDSATAKDVDGIVDQVLQFIKDLL